jgi:hypothetical protein
VIITIVVLGLIVLPGVLSRRAKKASSG